MVRPAAIGEGVNEGEVLDERFALAPDPELARIAWERVRDGGLEVQSEDLIRLLGFSTAAGDFLVRHPDEGAAVADPPERDRATLDREVAADVDHLGAVAGLRRFRRRAILRVAGRDLAGATVDDVVREISDVADACVQAACPPTLAVIALGKWGGRELNYASDIDLLLVHGVEDPGATQLVRTLSEQTEDGIAFKVDAARGAGGPRPPPRRIEPVPRGDPRLLRTRVRHLGAPGDDQGARGRRGPRAR